MADNIDYKKMWETLKTKIKSDKEYYADGYMCSMAESVHGENVCDNILKHIAIIERNAGI